MKQFFSLPFWVIVLAFLVGIVVSLFIGDTHIHASNWRHLSIKVEKPVTAILMFSGYMASIFNW